MEALIRILMLEDSPDDAEYIQKTLRRANVMIEATVVSTKDDFISRLNSFSPDVVLSDHQLPQFNSTQALQICKENFPFLPFILVTGAASEEFAASIIKAGADDYLLKNNLKRLPTAITQAIDKRRTQESLFRSEEANKSAERSFQAAHERLLFHLENTPLGYIEWDNQLRVQFWSKRSEEIFGWTEADTIQKHQSGFQMIFEGDLSETTKIIKQLLDGSVGRNKVVNRNYTKDGRVIWCEWFNSVMKNKHGEVITIMSLVQDVTAQKTFEDILKEYNERYQMLSKATNDAIWDWDIVHDFELWNHGIQTIFGYKEREIVSTKNWWKEKIHPADFQRIIQEISDAFAAHASNWSSQYQYLCADGTYKYVLDRGYIIYLDNQPIRMIGAMQDITEQKNSIEEIKKLSLVASKTNNSVIITDADYRVEWVNEGFMKSTGYSLQEISGLNPGLILQGHETDPTTLDRISERLKKNESFTEEVVYYSKRGDKYWMRLDISPVFDTDNQLNHFITIQTDISSQKEFENQITNIARDLSSLIENANVPILGIDRNGYVNEWNRNAAGLTEYSKNEVLEKKLISLVESNFQDELSEIINKVLKGESTQNYHLPFLNKSGKRLILFFSISPRMDINKNIYGAICVGQDITELIQYREGLERMVEERTRELNQALQKEKELVELKSRFVSIASHEFRTPLSTISLVIGLLHKHREKITTDEYHVKLDSIEKQVKHMTFLLDDILVIGKGEAGKIITHYTTVSIENFFSLTAREVEQNASNFRIKLLMKCSAKEFKTDEKLLRNILTNLLTNAIKFSSYIKIVYLTVSNTADYLKFEVEDKGIGIADEDMANIFTAFHRGGNVGTVQGTGLGLSIVKKAVELLKGDIKISSKIGKGTIITVMLPLKAE